MNLLFTIQLLLDYVLKIFLASFFLIESPVSRTPGSHFKTWIIRQKLFKIPNGFWKCLIGTRGSIWWKNWSKKIQSFQWKLFLFIVLFCLVEFFNFRIITSPLTFIFKSRRDPMEFGQFLKQTGSRDFYICTVKSGNFSIGFSFDNCTSTHIIPPG